jgi:hypothetical protein
MAKALAESHGGYAGMSIIEMLEERLYKVAEKYVSLPLDGRTDVRGEIRGLSVSIAMMRHPLRRYDQAWWGYVKKIEKRAVANARLQQNNNE